MDEKNKRIVEFFSNSVSCDGPQLDQFIEEGLDLNGPLSLEDGIRPLHAAAKNGNVDMVQNLLDRGAYIDVPDYYGNTPLHLASKEGHVDVVCHLMEKGANLILENDKGLTFLQIAVCNEQVEVTRLLLSVGVEQFKLNINDKPILSLAVESGNTTLVRELITAGVDVNEASGLPLNNAVKNGNVELVKILVENGADVEMFAPSHHGSPLTTAAIKGHYDIVQILLESGAKLKDGEGQILLRNAYYRGYCEIARLLHENSVRITKEESFSSLELAISLGKIDVIRLILLEGLDVNEWMWNDCSLLMIAIQSRQVAVTKFLLEKGANVNYRNSEGRTALYYSMFGYCSTFDDDSIQIIKLLLNAGASLNDLVCIKEKKTLLHLASCSNVDLFELILMKTLDVKAKDFQGSTPLLLVIENSLKNNVDDKKLIYCVKRLLEEGASPNTVNDHGKTPLNVAINFKSMSLVRLILESKFNIDTYFKFNVSSFQVQSGKELIQQTLEHQESNQATNYHQAAYEDNVTFFGIPLISGDINALTKDGFTPLQIAMYKCEFQQAMYLIDKGADVNIKDKYGFLPIHLAFLYKNIPLFEKLCCKTVSNDLFGIPLLHFVLQEDLIFVECTLKKCSDINVRDEKLNTVLHIAVKMGRSEIVDFLLENKVDIQAQNDTQDTALLIALKSILHNKSTDFVIAYNLLSHGADVTTTDHTKLSALHLAARIGAVSLARLILEKGVQDIDAKDCSGYTPLTCAFKNQRSENSNTDLIALFIENGSMVIHDYQEISILKEAISRKQHDFIELMLRHGLTFSSDEFLHILDDAMSEETPDLIQLIVDKDEKFDCKDFLFRAIHRGASVKVLHLLLKKIGVNCNNERNQSPLQNVLLFDFLDSSLSGCHGCMGLKYKYGMAQLFLDMGATVIFDYNTSEAFRSITYVNFSMINILIDKIGDINATDDNGRSLLLRALFFKIPKLVRLLLDRGASAKISSVSQTSPLHLAAGQDNGGLVKEFLNKGAKINATTRYLNTPLHFATVRNSLECVEILINYGALLTSKNNKGNTPLHLADQPQIIEILLANGASTEDTNNDGETPYSLKRFSRHPKGKVVLGDFILKQKLAGIATIDHVEENNTLTTEEEAPCLEELEKLKLAKINDSFCLYDILSSFQSPMFLFDEELVQRIEALFQSESLDQFPNFGVVVRNIFIRSKRSRFYLTRRALKIMLRQNCGTECQNCGCKCQRLPDLAWERVFGFLSIEELENVIACAN